MKILEIAFTALPVSDLKKSRAFYEEVLGLKASSVFEKDGMGFVEYDIASGTLAIGAGSPHFKTSTEGGGVALEVEDFDGTILYLKEKDCKFLMEPYETPVCHMALIVDPDHNRLLIHKRKKKD